MNKIKQILENNNIVYTVLSGDKILIKYGQDSKIVLQIEITKVDEKIRLFSELYTGEIIKGEVGVEHLQKINETVCYIKEIEYKDDNLSKDLISSLGEICLIYLVWMRQNGKNG